MGFGEAEDREPFGRVVFEPVGEFRVPGPVRLDQFVEGGLRLLDPLRVGSVRYTAFYFDQMSFAIR